MKIKTRLLIAFSFILVILLIMGANVIQTLSNQNNNMNIIVEEYYERVRLAQELEDTIQTTARLTRDLLLIQSPEMNQGELSKIRENLQNKSSILNELEKLTVNIPEKKTLINELVYLCSSYDQIIESILFQIEKGNYIAGKNILFGETSEIRNRLIVTIDQLTGLEEQSINNVFRDSVASNQSSLAFNTFFLTVSIFIVISILVYIAKSVTKSINDVRNVMKKIPNQSFDHLPRIKIQANDEIGDVAKAYNNMAEVVERFALKEKEITENLTVENWLKSNYAEAFSLLQGNLKIEVFGNKLINHLSNTVEATFGAFYLKDNNERFFREISAYGGSHDKAGFEMNTFELGEGLAGQCALNNKIIYLEKLPTDYVRTKSSLGEALPTSLIILPISFEDEVIGTVELAKFKPFTVMEKKLLEQICNSIGTNIKRVLYHMEIESLLSKSQALAEELQVQSEELQQQQEELRMVNEELFTENKRSEEKNKELLQMKEHLEGKNREILLSSKYKSEFLANMSHELRTPLNSLLILAQILTTNSERNLTDKQVEYANTIYTSGKDLLELINDILDLSKVEAGKIDVYPEEIALEDIIAFVKRQFSHMAEVKGLEFQVNIDDDLPVYLYTDEQRLKQILKNLLSNAFKFTNKGKVIFHVTKSRSIDKTKLTFSVIDTGIGIPKKSQEDIFEAFNQLDGTTSRKYGGTGLGLSISRELSELLGGYISVTSTEGEGSIFSLYLPDYPQYPINDVEPLVAATKEELPIEENELMLPMSQENEFFNECLEGKSVLIVDDDMRNVFALTSFLEGQKMVVSFAENGKDAIKALKFSTVDIVLMDIMMPEMNGFDAMREIRKIEEFSDLPIIALTAKAMKEDREKCIKAGASDYISKPVKTERLLSLIKVWLSKE